MSDMSEVDGTNGYYQIVVPNFGTAAPALPTASQTGAVALSSFLRLGIAGTTSTGTESDPTSTYGAQLLNVALNSSPIAAGNLYNDGLVDANGDALNPVATTIATPLFSDDVRDHGDASAQQCNGLTVAQRAAESALLLTKGGWRDHTDGNRITTTYGDKVEVIRGNYKLVVLGRQDHVGNGHTFESSGGMLQDNDLAPGQVTEISWVETQGGTWRVVETCTKGDVDTTYDGKVVERFVGGSVTSIVGKESNATATSAIDATAQARMQLEYQDALANGYVDASVTFTQYLTQRGYGDNSNLDYFRQEGGGSNPNVYEQTWAERIESYTGSQKTPVPNILETTWATTITEETYATTLTESVGSSGNPVSSLTENVHATSLQENVNATTITAVTTVSGAITETTTAPLTVQTHTGALVDNHFGFKWENIFGAWGRVAGGLAVELFVGFGVEINLGPALEVNVGLSFSVATQTVEAVAQEFKFSDLTLKSLGMGLLTAGFYTIT